MELFNAWKYFDVLYYLDLLLLIFDGFDPMRFITIKIPFGIICLELFPSIQQANHPRFEIFVFCFCVTFRILYVGIGCITCTHRIDAWNVVHLLYMKANGRYIYHAWVLWGVVTYLSWSLCFSNAQEVLNSPLLLPEKSNTCKDMAAKEDFYFECLCLFDLFKVMFHGFDHG